MGMINPWDDPPRFRFRKLVHLSKFAGSGLNPWTPARLMVEWEPPTFLNGPRRTVWRFPAGLQPFGLGLKVMFGDVFFTDWDPMGFITILHHHFGEYLRNFFQAA